MTTMNRIKVTRERFTGVVYCFDKQRWDATTSNGTPLKKGSLWFIDNAGRVLCWMGKRSANFYHSVEVGERIELAGNIDDYAEREDWNGEGTPPPQGYVNQFPQRHFVKFPKNQTAKAE